MRRSLKEGDGDTVIQHRYASDCVIRGMVNTETAAS